MRQSGQGRLRTGGDQVAAGRLMVAFLGLALRQKLEAEMRRAGMLERMSVAEVFVALPKVAALHPLDGRRHLLEIPKKTRQTIASLQLEAWSKKAGRQLEIH